MLNVRAKIASAFLLAAAAGAGWTILSPPAVLAADTCVTVPNAQAPQGQHWYYHIERGTGRHCWYLRGGDDKSSRSETPVAAAPDKPAPPRTEPTASRSIADAHAELAPRARVAGDAPAAASPPVWPSPASAASAPNAPAPSTASRWPKPAGAGTSAVAPTANQPAPGQQAPDASLMLANVQESDGTASADGAQTAPELPAAPVERNTGSLQKLLLVAAGALALAGLTGSAVYRLGRRRRNDWLRERRAPKLGQDSDNAPWVDPRFAPAHSIPDLDEVRLAAQDPGFSPGMGEDDHVEDGVERIEEYLARLTRQVQDEVGGSNAKRTERNMRAES